MKTTIKDLFVVGYGQKEYHSKEKLEGEEGENILISSKGLDNGLYGLFAINNYYKAPFITIPSTGSVGYAFVQHKDCSVDDNCLTLIPKNDMSIEEMYQIVFQLRRNIWKYKYGRQITPDRINKQEILIIKTDKKYTDYKENKQYTHILKSKVKEIPNIKLFLLSDLCEIKKKNALPQNAINLDGTIPYITTTSKNNGVSNFTDEEYNFEAPAISVALNGSVCEVFYQNKNFLTSGDNAVLYLKEEHKKLSQQEILSFLLFIGSIIKKEKWKYNYYRKLTKTKLMNILIPLPTYENKIDVKFINKLVLDLFKNKNDIDILL